MKSKICTAAFLCVVLVSNTLASDAGSTVKPAAQTAKEKLPKKTDYLILKKELEQIFKNDQESRLKLEATRTQYGEVSKEYQSLQAQIVEADKANLKRVKEILDQYGWIGSNKIGARANSTLSLVIQHANVTEWEKYLPMLRSAVKDKNAKAADLAYLEDRYLTLGLKKPQIYGSQTVFSDGVIRLAPIEDPEHVDERRAAVGLEPIAKYLQQWNLIWDVESYKKAWEMAEKKAKDDHAQLISRASQFIEKNAYLDAVREFQKAFELKDGNRSSYYDAACAAALAGQREIAFTWLNQALDHNWTDMIHMKGDTDLDSLHGLPEWQAAVEKLQANLVVLEKNYNKPLQAELEQILTDDQGPRQQIEATVKKYGRDSKELKDLWANIEKKDALNLKRVKAILDQYGWIGPDKVGERGSMTLFLVIQHADEKEWEKYLPMMRIAVKEKKAKGADLALLEDRYLAFGLHQRQIYGSQLQEVNGVTRLMPIEDPEHVDERRAAIGLQPIAAYIKQWNLTWNIEELKKAWELEEEKATEEAKKK
ncbi:MAG: hypothetical protein K2P84_14005 [Undibacterium sp.]|nr:hypothetical protein [Undibacterium sp.]